MISWTATYVQGLLHDTVKLSRINN